MLQKFDCGAPDAAGGAYSAPQSPGFTGSLHGGEGRNE